MKTAVTISLVEEARGGPFVFWDGLADGFEQAAALGFDAVEIFAPGPDAVNHVKLNGLIESTGLNVAAVGTGAGMVKHKLNLTDLAGTTRDSAVQFIKSMIDFGELYDAPAIIGSMQGRWGEHVDKPAALRFLGDNLSYLADYAEQKNLPLIYEPLNRYESNLINTLEEAVDFLSTKKLDNVKLLADLFHMNIEESDPAEAIRRAGDWIGHVHYVDSNRQAAGFGHTDFASIAKALKDINYSGYLSAEVFPLPDSKTAAAKTIESVKRFF